MIIRMPIRTVSLALALSGGLALTACDSSTSREGNDDATMAVVEVEEATPSAAEEAAPVVAETAEPVEDKAPNEALPPPVASSEESVQPESETLFY